MKQTRQREKEEKNLIFEKSDFIEKRYHDV